MDGLGIVSMGLSLGTHLVTPHGINGKVCGQSKRIEGLGMLLIGTCGNVIQRNTTDSGYGSREVFVDDLSGDTDGLKDSAALIGLDGGNTHLGRDLDDSGDNCLVVVLHCRIVVLIQNSLIDQFFDGCMCQIRVHCTGTIAQQCSKMMNSSRFTGLKDQ